MICRAVGRGLVGVCKEHTGRGPTRYRTFLNGEVLTFLFSEMLTPGERALVEGGRPEPVREMRRQIFEQLRPEIDDLILREVGRAVTVGLCDHCVRSDTGVMIFVLGSGPGEPADCDTAEAVPVAAAGVPS